jgi:hypothetical protein
MTSTIFFIVGLVLAILTIVLLLRAYREPDKTREGNYLIDATITGLGVIAIMATAKAVGGCQEPGDGPPADGGLA